MLYSAEKVGLENILDLLPTPELFALCDTVTKRMCKFASRNEATEAIFSCIQSPQDLLKRQKITRKLIFSYLQSVKEFVSPELSKMELVMKCVEKWKKSDNKIISCTNSSTAIDYIEDMEINLYTEEEVSNGNSAVRSEKPCSVIEPWDDKTMALEFIKWFFPIFNNLDDFGTKHFWPDVKLEVIIGNYSIFDGDQAVVTFLNSLVTNHKLYFHPNDSVLSIKCEHEIHGMVKITVNGILHQIQDQLRNPVGYFESRFGLLRNIDYDNNWKIKWLFLDLKANSF